MPKATFYTHVSQPLLFACRLAERAARDGGRVLIWCGSAQLAARLNRDLWQAAAESFIPHEIWYPGEAMPSETAVLLASGTDMPQIPPDTAVLNLSPDFWSDAPAVPRRVLEIAGAGLEDLAEARERFRAYRRQGFEIEHHNMQGKA